VALISFDYLPLADLLRPGVSVVAQDPGAMGREVARLLFECLDGE
jgi:LacI family transcriptional regulator